VHRQFADRVIFQIAPYQIRQSQDALMSRDGGGRQVVLPIDDLVPQTIVRERHIVGVRELGLRTSWLQHAPLYAQIVPSSPAKVGRSPRPARNRLVVGSPFEHTFIRPDLPRTLLEQSLLLKADARPINLLARCTSLVASCALQLNVALRVELNVTRPTRSICGSRRPLKPRGMLGSEGAGGDRFLLLPDGS
jgi:hypothetical protein